MCVQNQDTRDDRDANALCCVYLCDHSDLNKEAKKRATDRNKREIAAELSKGEDHGRLGVDSAIHNQSHDQRYLCLQTWFVTP